MDDHFDCEVDDTVWVPDVGKRGWVILSKDSRLRSNPLEQIALLKSGTHSFLLTAANLSGPQMATAFITAMPDILGMINKFKPPFVATVNPSGTVSVFCTHDQLLDMISARKA
jgi:hypothetical protein